MPAVTTLTSGVNAIAATVQTALTNNYLRKTSGNILNADINAGAAIAYSKLNLGTSIVNADINAAAAIVGTKIATGTITSTNILDGTIVNADVNAAAAIAFTKVAGYYYCMAYRSTASGSQSFGSATGVVSFSAAMDNSGAMWAGGTPTRVTAPVTSWYRVMVAGYASGTGLTTDHWILRKNGVTTLADSAGATGVAGPGYIGAEVGVFALTAADYLELVFVRVAGTSIGTAQPNQPQYSCINPADQGGHYGAMVVHALGA